MGINSPEHVRSHVLFSVKGPTPLFSGPGDGRSQCIVVVGRIVFPSEEDHDVVQIRKITIACE
jgi:hypothetical protein